MIPPQPSFQRLTTKTEGRTEIPKITKRPQSYAASQKKSDRREYAIYVVHSPRPGQSGTAYPPPLYLLLLVASHSHSTMPHD